MTKNSDAVQHRVYQFAIRMLSKDWLGFEIQAYLAQGRRCFYRQPNGKLMAIVAVDCYGWMYKAYLVDGTSVSWSRSERLRGAWLHHGPATRQ